MFPFHAVYGNDNQNKDGMKILAAKIGNETKKSCIERTMMMMEKDIFAIKFVYLLFFHSDNGNKKEEIVSLSNYDLIFNKDTYTIRSV